MGSKKDNNQEVKEYGVVLKKNKKHKHKIFPQKGRVPEEDDDSYKIV
ncbi:MAG: hypothetical protein KGD68_12530 [Candidatus Lokiarchaeota archaeon]|nr:hypothetical protein [Candidatus Lokiarchaeota archaeon]